MPTQQKAKIVTAADVEWASSAGKFNGFLLLGIALPTGYSEVFLEDADSRVRLPQWLAIPVQNGVVNAEARVFFTSSLEPPNCRYAPFWYDENWTRVSTTTPTLLEIEADPYTITPPTLTAPTAPVAAPTLDS